MPDILEMMQSNPEMFNPQQAAQAAEPEAVGGSTPEFTGQVIASGGGSSWQDARQGRVHGHLSNPGFQDSLAAHHQALADASALNHQAEQEFTLLHSAHILHDTGAYYKEAHGIHPTDPDYEDKMIGLASKYPFAKPESALMQPLHEARQTYLTANSAIEQRKEAEQDKTHILAAVSSGHITPDELQNDPTLRAKDGSLNVNAVRFRAASRASGQAPGGVAVQPLTKEEAGIWKKYSLDPRAYEKDIRVPADVSKDPAAMANKALFWRAAGKINPQPTAAAPTASSTPNPLLQF